MIKLYATYFLLLLAVLPGQAFGLTLKFGYRYVEGGRMIEVPLERGGRVQLDLNLQAPIAAAADLCDQRLDVTIHEYQARRKICRDFFAVLVPQIQELVAAALKQERALPSGVFEQGHIHFTYTDRAPRESTLQALPAVYVRDRLTRILHADARPIVPDFAARAAKGEGFMPVIAGVSRETGTTFEAQMITPASQARVAILALAAAFASR